MRIVHVSTSDLGGGAARSAYRIHRGLVAAGVDSRFLTGQKLSDDPTVSEIFPPRWSNVRRLARERLDRLPLRLYPRRPAEIFSLNWVTNQAWRAIAAAEPTIVHLHWVNHGLLPFRHLPKLGKPIVWNLWDQWPFTGGCHYSGACRAYERECGACPELASRRPQDLSAWLLRAKRRAWRDLPLELVTPSQWLAERVRASSLFSAHRCTVLPQAVDTRVFHPTPMAQARTLLGLDPNAMVVTLGATHFGDRRKGFDLVEPAVRAAIAQGGGKNLTFCTFGEWPQGAPREIGGRPVHHLGRLGDELSVALAFCAADVALVPSREEAGPQVTVEALACGTPVIGFPIGVTAEVVRHEQNGFLATPFESETLAAGLAWAVKKRGDPAVRAAARQAAVDLADLTTQIPRYLEIYHRARIQP